MDKRVLPNEVLLEEVGRLLDEGREVSFTPLGNSMLPFIHGGKDNVVLRKMPSAAVGDIVLVRLPGRYILHRIIALDGEKVTLMGDGNLVGTENCTWADIMGTVTAIQKGKRSVKPGNGRLWRVLKPFRRYILGIYKRLI